MWIPVIIIQFHACCTLLFWETLILVNLVNIFQDGCPCVFSVIWVEILDFLRVLVGFFKDFFLQFSTQVAVYHWAMDRRVASLMLTEILERLQNDSDSGEEYTVWSFVGIWCQWRRGFRAYQTNFIDILTYGHRTSKYQCHKAAHVTNSQLILIS